jgi:hypothetical protein
VILGALLLASFWSWWPRAGGGARTLVWTAAFTLVMADWIGLLVLGRASLVYLLPAIVLILGVLARRGRATGSWPGIIGIALAAFISWAPALLSVEGEGFGVGGASMGLLATVLGLLWVRWWVTRGAEIRTFMGESGAEG